MLMALADRRHDPKEYLIEAFEDDGGRTVPDDNKPYTNYVILSRQQKRWLARKR